MRKNERHTHRVRARERYINNVRLLFDSLTIIFHIYLSIYIAYHLPFAIFISIAQKRNYETKERFLCTQIHTCIIQNQIQRKMDVYHVCLFVLVYCFFFFFIFFSFVVFVVIKFATSGRLKMNDLNNS